MAIPNSTWTEILSTTISHYSPQIADNVLNHIPLLERMKRKGNTSAVPGGVYILEQLLYNENATFKWYSGLETLDTAQSDVVTSAQFSWKEANVNVVISGLDKAQNSGSKETVHRLVKARVSAAEKTMANNIGAALFYSNTENSGKAIGGLQHLVADLPTSGTVGGINRATAGNEWWRNQYYDFSGESVTPGATTIQHAMNTIFINAQRGRDKIDMFVGDATYFTYYLESLQANQRFMSNETAGAGFASLKFWGGAADVFYDSGVPASHMYGLNTDTVFFRPHSDFNMVPGDDRVPVNQDATVMPMFFKGNMTINNPSLNGVICA